VLAESAQKGVAFDDEQEAYDLARVAAYENRPGRLAARRDLPDYIAKGYVPSDFRMARSPRPRSTLRPTRRSGAGRRSSGSTWTRRTSVRAARATCITGTRGRLLPSQEVGRQVGAVRHPDEHGRRLRRGERVDYLWMVPHDPEGLADTLGGTEARSGGCASSSSSPWRTSHVGRAQPLLAEQRAGHRRAWYFAAWGSPGETFRWVDWIVTQLYTSGSTASPATTTAAR